MDQHTLERFWSKVTKSADCWTWTGTKTKTGYGQMSVGGRAGGMKYAHRISYEIANGPIPRGLEIDHLCVNPSCVNPAHMEAVTRTVNMHRSSRIAAQMSVTHCPRGHEYSKENTYRHRGHRYCRTCARTRAMKPNGDVRVCSRTHT